MNRLTKVVGFAAGAVALVWAMRDRFISVATSREPQVPAFRTPSSSPGVDVIDGIGPVYAKRLAEAGISDIATLAKATPDRVAESASVSAARARTWIDLATKQ